MPSNSRRAAKPRADTHLSRTEAKLLVSQSYKLPTPANRLPSNYDEHAPFSHHECTRQVFKQSYREPCPVKISLYLATYYIGNVRSTTSVLGNQSTGLKGDAVPAQSRCDDSKDPPTTPLSVCDTGVCDAPATSDDRNATAGGGGYDTLASQQRGDTTRPLETHEDSYQLPHESSLSLGANSIEEWRVSIMNTLVTLVSLKTLPPTCHERHLSRQGPRTAIIFTRKITMTLSESMRQSDSAQPPSTSSFDAAAEQANIGTLVLSCIPDRLPVQQDRDSAMARLLPNSPLMATSAQQYEVLRAMTPQLAARARRSSCPGIPAPTTVPAPRLSVKQLARSPSTKGHLVGPRSEVKNFLARPAYSHGYKRTRSPRVTTTSIYRCFASLWLSF